MFRNFTITLALLFFAAFTFAQTHTVEAIDNEFVPEDITVQEGDTVLWVNNGTIIHTTTSGTNCDADGTWDSGNMDPGEEFMYVFNESGDYPYFCIPHCAVGMTGSVTVEAVSSARKAEIGLLEVYPNPVLNKVWMDLSNLDAHSVNVRVANLSGQTVKDVRNLRTGSTVDINLANLNEGVYFLQLWDDGNILTSNRILKAD